MRTKIQEKMMLGNNLIAVSVTMSLIVLTDTKLFDAMWFVCILIGLVVYGGLHNRARAQELEQIGREEKCEV